MKTAAKPGLFAGSFNLLMILKRNENHCYWCGQKLCKCEACGGRGTKSDSICLQCNGNGTVCKVHKIDWE